MAIERDGEGPSLRREDSKPRQGGRDELRATAFTDDVFDDDYYGRRPASAKGARSFSLAVGVVLGLAIVGGVGWYAFRGGMVSIPTGAPQDVKADTAPYKMKPDNPGGMQVENQDKLVYDRVAKGNAPSRVENLLPPPEEPKAPPQKPKVEEAKDASPPAKPAAPPPPAATAPMTPAPPQVAADDKKALEAMVKATETPNKAPESQPAAAPKATEPAKIAEAPAPPPSSAPDPLAAAVAAAAPGKTSATGPINVGPAQDAAKTAPTDAKPATDAPVQTASAAAPAVTGGAFRIQAGSVPTEDAANSEWTRLSRLHKDLLGSLSPDVTKADLGDKGIYYRLRAGPLADKAAADALCASLAAEKTGCIVIKP